MRQICRRWWTILYRNINKDKTFGNSLRKITFLLFSQGKKWSQKHDRFQKESCSQIKSRSDFCFAVLDFTSQTTEEWGECFQASSVVCFVFLPYTVNIVFLLILFYHTRLVCVSLGFFCSAFWCTQKMPQRIHSDLDVSLSKQQGLLL